MQEDRKALRAARLAAREARIAAREGRPVRQAPVHATPAPRPVAIGEAPPLPPASLVERAIATKDMVWFDRSGAISLADWQRALLAVGRGLEEFPRVMDFGCGCGRVLRHLRGALRPEQELIGVDVDGEAVAWVNANLAGVEAHQLGHLPPAPIADDSIDLIVNHGVFTHLPEHVQNAWLSDLKRVLRPGGIAILSFHNRGLWQEFREKVRANGMAEDDLQRFDANFHRNGFHHHPGRNAFEQGLPEYYGTAIHSLDYIDRQWQRYFEILAWLPRGSFRHQDIVVVRKN